MRIPIGASPSKESTWEEPIIQNLTKKLSGWKHRHLSFGGRICLLKFALSALPLFFLSFFKMLSGIGGENSKGVLWGKGEEGGKITWLKWDKVCLPLEEGGLRVKNIKLFK